MKGIFIALLLGSACQALPNYDRLFSTISGSKSAESAIVLPNGESLPADTQFLTRKEHQEGDTIYGEYSYKDPHGALVTVKYTMGVNGQNYSENRKIHQSYGSDKIPDYNLVSTIIGQLTPTVNQILNSTLAESKSQYDHKSLVQEITAKLQAVVYAAVQKALGSTSTNISLGDHTEQVLSQLSPIIEQGVREHITLVSSSAPSSTGSNFNDDQVVSEVIVNLKPEVITVVDQIVTSVPVDSEGQKNVVEKAITQLRPLIQSSVIQAVSTSGFKGHIDIDYLIDRILSELKSDIESSVHAAIKLYANQPRPQFVENVPQQQEQQVLVSEVETTYLSEDDIVIHVTQAIKPVIIQVVKSTVKELGTKGMSVNQLVEIIKEKLRPTVQKYVEEAISHSNLRVNPTQLTQKIITAFTSNIHEGVENELKLVKNQQAANAGKTETVENTEKAENEIIKKVTDEVKPTVSQIIKSTVQSLGEDFSNPEQVVLTINYKLNPIVYQVVVSALKKNNLGYLNADKITDTVISELLPFIRSQLQKEIQQHEALTQTQSEVFQTAVKLPIGGTILTEDEIVAQVTKELRPIIIEVVRSYVQKEGVDLSDQAQLLNNIIIRLKPVIYQTVISALGGSSRGNLNADRITERIATLITPFINEALQKEIKLVAPTGQQQTQQQSSTALTENAIVQKVIAELRPTVIKVVKETVREEGADLTDEDGLVQTITIKLRPIIYQIVVSSLGGASNGNLNADSITERIIAQLISFVPEAVHQEVTVQQQTQQPASTGLTEGAIVQKVTTELRPIIIKVVKETVQQKGIDLSNQENLVSQITIKLRPIVYQFVVTSLGGTTQGNLNADSITDKIISQLMSFIREAVGQEIKQHQQTQQPATPATPVLSESVIVQKVTTELRPTIIKVVKETVQQKGIDLSNQENLVSQITIKLRPIVYQIVVSSLGGSTQGNLNADSITDKIISQLMSFIREAVQQEITLHQQTQQPATPATPALSESVIVQKVTTELRPIIIKVVKETVQQKGIDLSNQENLVSQITIKLRPIVYQFVVTSLGGTTQGNLNADSITDKIISQLMSFIREAVGQEITLHQQTQQPIHLIQQQEQNEQQEPSLTDELIVQQVSTELKPTVIQAVKETVLQQGVDLNNQGNLIDQITIKLRPVVYQVVTSSLGGPSKGNLRADRIIDKILAEMASFIREAVQQEVQQYQHQIPLFFTHQTQQAQEFQQIHFTHHTFQQQSSSASDEEIIKKLINELRPIVIQLVKSTVQQQGVDLSDLNVLVSQITINLRPIVYQLVVAEFGLKGNSNVDDITDRTLSELAPFIQEVVLQEVEAVHKTQPHGYSAPSEDIIVQKVNQQLRPTVIQVVKDIVVDQSEDLSDEGSMVSQITVKLRPIVQQNVITSLGEKSKGNLNPDRITDRIINELTSFIQDTVQQEVKQHQPTQQEQSSGQTENTIVQKAHEELRPTVIQVVKDTILEQGDDLSDQASMVNQITVKMRPIVQQNVISSLGGTSKGSLNSDKITDRIISELTSFIREAVQKEVEQLLKSQPSRQSKPEITENEIVQKVNKELRPTVIQVVKETVQQEGVDISNQVALVSQITIKLRPIVYQIVVSSLGGTSKGNLKADSITDRILSELTSFIREAVQQEVDQKLQGQTSGSTLTEEQIVETVIQQLKVTLIQVVRSTVLQQGSNNFNQGEVVNSIAVQMRPVIYKNVVSSLGGSSRGNLNSDRITDNIITKLMPFITDAVQKETEVQAQQKPAGQTEDKIVAEVIEDLRPSVDQLAVDVVNSKEVDQSNLDLLVKTVETRLKTLILSLVSRAVQGDKSGLNANRIADRIIEAVIPLIREAVQKQLSILGFSQSKGSASGSGDVKLSGDQEEQLIFNVVLNLDSTIKSLVGKSLESSKPLTESQVDSFVTSIVNQLRAQIISAIQIQLNGFLSGSAQAFVSSNSYEILLQKIFLEIRKFIIEEIKLITENSPAPTTNPGYSGSLSQPSGPASRPTGPISHPYGPVSGTYGPASQPSVPIQQESGSKPAGPVSQATGTKPQPAGSSNQPLSPAPTPSGPMPSKSMGPMAPMAQSIFGNSGTNFVKFQSPSYKYEFNVD